MISAFVCRNGRMIIMHYRKSLVTVWGRQLWDYRPEHSDVWRPVKNRQIEANLNAGNHPHDSITVLANRG